MKILIPTRGRPHVQITANTLRAAGVPYTLVRTESDDSVYSLDDHPDQVRAPVSDIMEKRNWIMDQHLGKKIFVVDDDMFFFRVLEGLAIPAGPHDIRRMLELIDGYLDEYAHVGIARRYMIQEQKQPFSENQKILGARGYNLALFPDPIPRFRLKAVSDFDYQMQLTASSLSALIVTEYCQEDGPYLAAGGCSIWRSNETIREGMLALKAYWPDYVRLRTGDNLPGGTLATIYFKKMAKDYACRHFPKEASTNDESQEEDAE